MTDREAADFLKKATLFISVPRKNTKTVTQLLYLEAMAKAIAALEEKAKKFEEVNQNEISRLHD